jgi:hypothetical protein
MKTVFVQQSETRKKTNLLGPGEKRRTKNVQIQNRNLAGQKKNPLRTQPQCTGPTQLGGRQLHVYIG